MDWLIVKSADPTQEHWEQETAAFGEGRVPSAMHRMVGLVLDGEDPDTAWAITNYEIGLTDEEEADMWNSLKELSSEEMSSILKDPKIKDALNKIKAMPEMEMAPPMAHLKEEITPAEEVEKEWIEQQLKEDEEEDKEEKVETNASLVQAGWLKEAV